MDIHPDQEALTFGGHWIHFGRDRLITFGHVNTLAETVEMERTEGACDDDYLRGIIDADQEGDSTGHVYGRAYSTTFPGGVHHYGHKRDVWPIEERLFEAAREVGWDVDRLPEEHKFLVQLAHATWRASQLTGGRA